MENIQADKIVLCCVEPFAQSMRHVHRPCVWDILLRFSNLLLKLPDLDKAFLQPLPLF